MFVSRIAPRMDRVVGDNHPTVRGSRSRARTRLSSIARRVDDWTLETLNPPRHLR